MYTVEFTVTGSYTPFLIILRDVDTELLVDSKVLHQEGSDMFTNLDYGNYVVEVYDSAAGFREGSVPQITTTTLSP